MKCWVILLLVATFSIQSISAQATKLYVGNLSRSTTDDTLRTAFQDIGQVIDSIVMRDRDTGRSRGFGFLTMSTIDEAAAAVNALNESDLDGRRIRVNIANARPSGHMIN